MHFVQHKYPISAIGVNLRDPKYLEEDNKRYGDIKDILVRMMLSLKSMKNISETKKGMKISEN